MARKAVSRYAEQDALLAGTVAKCKRACGYDADQMALALGMSFAFFGQIRGIGVGTVVCAALNGLLIRAFSQVFEKHFAFQDRFSLRPIFTEREDTL